MKRNAHRLLLAALGVWVLTPMAVLALRAAARSWRFPQILPNVGDDWGWVAVGGGERVVSALIVSVGLAIVTGTVGTALGFLVARRAVHAPERTRRLALTAALFAVLAPPLPLGVGLQVALLSIGLGGTLVGVGLAHLVPITGYLTLFAIGAFTTLDASLEDEARTLGASRWQVVSKVLVPLLKRRLFEGAILGGLISWGQVATTLLVGGGLVRTLPVELLSLVQSGNDQVGALAALVLSLPPTLTIGLLALGARRTGATV